MLENKKPILIILALVVVLLTGAIFLSLQSANPSEERGKVSGYVVDAGDHSPMRGVTVMGEDQDGTRFIKHENTDTSGPDGYFCLELPPNDYTLVFEADGYQTFQSSASYTVKNGEDLEIQEAFRLVKDSSGQADAGAGGQTPQVTPGGTGDGGQTPQVSPGGAGDGGQEAALPPSENPGVPDYVGSQEETLDPGASSLAGTPGTDNPDDGLFFPDPALERAIRTALKLGDGRAITPDDTLAVKTLDLAGGGQDEAGKIRDITGLAAFSNLEELSLQSNRVSDLSELSALKKLKKLQLESNQISDLTPLQGLDSLRKLEVAHNAISDISPLYSLNRLELLDVIDNKITSISGIGRMAKLHTLRLGRNRITDISPLAELQDLTHLGFGYNKVKDISPLYDLPMLHVLTMNGNQVSDITPVLYMRELHWLEVAGNPIGDPSIFDRLPESVTHLEK